MIKRAKRWLKIKYWEWKKLIEFIQHFGIFSPLVKIRINQLLVHTFIYPLARIITKDSEKSYKICEFFIKTPILSEPFSFPASLAKNKMLLKKNQDWGVIIELYMNDSYHRDAIKEGMTVVDIGAHIGGYATLSAQKVGSMGKVIAIEPETQNYLSLQENIKINGFKNVIPVKIALSDHVGFEKLYLSPWSSCHGLIIPTIKQSRILDSIKTNNNETPSITVPVTTLDALLAKLNIKKIDIIKIDAEGTEIAILKGAQKTLENNPGVKIIVASYHYPNEVLEVQNFLQKKGFKTSVSYCDIVSTI